MRERVEFLQKLGLSVDDITEYPLMLGCSVRKYVIPVLAYLEKIGIPRSKQVNTLRISHKYCMLVWLLSLSQLLSFFVGLVTVRCMISVMRCISFPTFLGIILIFTHFLAFLFSSNH
ncbi:hypothetical protein COP1_030325 [Malus domestica]